MNAKKADQYPHSDAKTSHMQKITFCHGFSGNISPLRKRPI
jgi:hypothetical protein